MSDNKVTKIEAIVLDDGRHAERHTCVDASGNEVVEIFAEEKRPLKLEKRIVREMKNIVAKETHEVIKDGEIAYQEVRSLEPDTPLQIRARIGVADHAKIVDGDYVRKDEIGKIVQDSVVAGVSALLEHMEPTQNLANSHQPIYKAQEFVEKNVEEKKKSENTTIMIMGTIILVQVAFVIYWFVS